MDGVVDAAHLPDFPEMEFEGLGVVDDLSQVEIAVVVEVEHERRRLVGRRRQTRREVECP